jgi:hypothetical protein
MNTSVANATNQKENPTSAAQQTIWRRQRKQFHQRRKRPILSSDQWAAFA